MSTVVTDATVAAGIPYAFFTSILAGILLAVGFQLLLTHLMVAVGLSAAGAVTDPDTSSSGKASFKGGSYSGLRKINAMFGFWALITASVSLFAGVWLAVAMNPYATWIHGVVIGLSVWAISYVISVSLDWMIGTSMLGMIASIARSSLQALGGVTGAIFGKSEVRQAADTAEAVARSVRQELFGKVDMRREMQKFLRQIQPEPRNIRKELEKLLNSVEITSVVSEHDRSKVIQSIHVNSSEMTKEKARSVVSGLKEIISSASQEAETDKPRVDKFAEGAMRAAGMSPKEAEETRQRLESYLRQTNKEELNPDGIKRDLERLFHDPKGGREALRARLSQVDRNTAATLIAQRADMSEEEARGKVDMVMSTIDSLVGRVQGKANGMEGQIQGRMEEAQRTVEGTKARALDQVEAYLAALEQPGEHLDPEAVRAEFELLLTDPIQGAKALFQRAKQLDEEELKTLISSNRYIDREDVDRMHKTILETRDQVITKAQEMEKEVEKRMEQLREEAFYHADQIRMTLSSAAWWLFSAAVVSGAAAAFAGWLAATL